MGGRGGIKGSQPTADAMTTNAKNHRLINRNRVLTESIVRWRTKCLQLEYSERDPKRPQMLRSCTIEPASRPVHLQRLIRSTRLNRTYLRDFDAAD